MSYPIAVIALSLATKKALCSILRSVHGFVQNCVTTRTLVVFSRHLDHDRAPCRAVAMRFTDVVGCENFLFSKCSPLARHASTGHDLEAFQWSCSCTRAVRVFWCQLAQSLGGLRNQPYSNGCVASTLFVWTHRVPMSFNPDLSR